MRPNLGKSAPAGALLLGMLLLSVGQLANAAGLPPLPKLPPLSDQKEWDAAIEKFSKVPDPKLARNRRLVMEAELGFAKSLRYGHVREIFEHYLAPNYVQHNPNVEPGREGIIRSFEAGVAPPEPKTKPGETPRTSSGITISAGVPCSGHSWSRSRRSAAEPTALPAGLVASESAKSAA